MRGLSYREVEERKKQGLYNGDCTVKTKSVGQIFFTNIFTLFNFVNIILAVLLCMVGSYKNLMFMGVVFWNLFIGIFQEIRSKMVIDRLTLLQEPLARVLREGRQEDIRIEDIVKDDIILLKNGKQITADSVVISGNCHVNESLLTGESDAVAKKEGDMLLSGSFLVSGNVVARVVNVGRDNYVNKITGSAKYLKKTNSEMMSSIKRIIKVVTIVLIPAGILLFLNQMKILDNNVKEAVEATVAAVIGMIPSGLVLLTTVVLAVSVIKLARKDALVKELYSIENLARVNVLCVDKTGTLTEGRMEVEDVISVCDKDSEGIKILLKKYISVFYDDNATSQAIAEYFNVAEEIQDENKDVTKMLSFSSERKYSAIEFKSMGTMVLGAYEFIVKKREEELLKRIEEFGKKGLRVLAFGWSTRPILGEELPGDIQILGVVLLADKIRQEVGETIEFFRKQGVLVKVISGDNPATVSYISKKVGIEHGEKYIDATKLDNGKKIREAAKEYNVFGRVTPDQKLLLIKALKENNTVAMIGDGVNDVMALKEADCSVAMESGSEAARNVSQLVLMNSDFASLPAIVAEGRQTVNNICRTAALYLNKTIYSSLFALMFIFLPLAYPIEPIQLTLVGSVTIGIPSFILALEKNHKRIEGEFLKKVLSNALPAGMLIVTNLLLILTLGHVTATKGIYVKALCAYSLAIGSFINLVNVCRPMNRFRTTIVSILLIMFLGVIILAGGFFELNLLNIKLRIFLAVFIVLSVIIFSVYKKLIKTILK